jgi:ribosomal protein S18 acetylase RimI-like enzyme
VQGDAAALLSSMLYASRLVYTADRNGAESAYGLTSVRQRLSLKGPSLKMPKLRSTAMDNVVRIDPVDVELLDQYAKIPMYLEANKIIKCIPIDGGTSGFRLSEQTVHPPFKKTYENTEDDPFPRHKKWDVSNWGIFIYKKNEMIVGGCVVAVRTEEIYMLEGRTDMAVLWDIRVHPEYQRSGIGSKLFQAAKAFAIESNCKLIKIETQNVNVPACHFYKRQGCHLAGMNMHAYSKYTEEVQLLWYMAL